MEEVNVLCVFQYQNKSLPGDQLTYKKWLVSFVPILPYEILFDSVLFLDVPGINNPRCCFYTWPVSHVTPRRVVWVVVAQKVFMWPDLCGSDLHKQTMYRSVSHADTPVVGMYHKFPNIAMHIIMGRSMHHDWFRSAPLADIVSHIHNVVRNA